MNSTIRKFAVFIALLTALCESAPGAEIDAGAERESFLPLISESTYTYDWRFKDRKGSATVVVKMAEVAGSNCFYFVADNDLQDPNALIGTNSVGLGAYLRRPEGVATLDCFFKNELNAMTKPALDAAVLFLKNSIPETGTRTEALSPQKSMRHIYTVEGRGDVTVPAGEFKDCLKLRIDEIHDKNPPEKNTVYSATAWLAKGVGVVKWIRGTGRVDELSAYRLGPAAK